MTTKMIELTIKTLDSQNHKFRVPDSYTILEFKEYIAEEVNVAVVQQRLIFCGRVLSNETKLADIGIDGKVMHLVQKVPRLSTTTSGSSSSTTTNTNSRSGQNGGPGFRGWHTHDPTVLFGAIGIPTEFMHAGDIPRLINARNHGTGNRVSLAMDMIRKSNEILNRLENPQSTGQSSATDVEQFPERTQAEATAPESSVPTSSIPASSSPASSVPASSTPESSVPEPSASESSASTQQSDPDSMNVSYEVDETFPNTVVVTIDATHHMRMPPALIRQMHHQLLANNSQSTSQSETEQTAENETSTVPETTPVGSTNQSPGYQATGTLPSFAASDQNLRNDRQTSENRSSTAINDRRRLRELIDQLNKLNARLQPFYAIYCQFINEDPQFSSTEGENGSHRAQTVFNNVSKVMHYISHVYHAISDLRVSFNRPPPRSFQSRPCLLQGTILHTAHSVTTTTTAPPPSTQQPTSTQTTSTSQSIPSVRAFRLDFMNPDGSLNETPNVSTPATSTETNTNMTVDPNTESNNASTEFPPETPHGVELMFDLAPGTIHIDAVEAAFVTPNASGPSQPTSVSQPSSSSETSNAVPMPIDWMDQMIDVISSGVRRPFTADHLDWSSMPTTSTRTPRVTPRTTDSSSTTNPPSQGLNRGQWDTSPRMDPFLPCSSHHFESNLRPMVLARRSTQGTDRSSSSVNSSNSTTDTSSPTSPNEVRPFSGRRPGRPRTRYVQDSDGFLSGIHPILAWGRNLRNNIATTSGTLNGQTAGQNIGLSDTFGGQIRVGMDSVFETLEREGDFDRPRLLNLPPLTRSGPNLTIQMEPPRAPNELLLTPVGDIPYFRDLQGQSILIDLFMVITRNWTLHDMLNLNAIDDESSINLNPVSRHNEALFNFVMDRVMLNQELIPHNINEAANRIFQEMMPYIEIFQCSVPSRSNINVSESFRSCIFQNLHGLIHYCDQIRSGAPNDIISQLTIFGERLLSLVVYCCNSRAVFRLSVMALMQFMPLPANLHRFLVHEVRVNIDQYWDIIASFHMMSLSIIDYIVPSNTLYEGGNTSSVINEERSSNPTLSSSETSNEPLPEVVIGSQEWHHNVPSDWVPVIARDSQRQRRQGTQPPYSDAYLSSMPNKRRKIVTSSKPQGPLSQIIAKNLEVAMGAAGVAVNKEVTASVGADASVQNAYTERIRTLGRTGIETHPDFCPVRYPNASKFFYDHNHPN